MPQQCELTRTFQWDGPVELRSWTVQATSTVYSSRAHDARPSTRRGSLPQRSRTARRGAPGLPRSARPITAPGPRRRAGPPRRGGARGVAVTRAGGSGATLAPRATRGWAVEWRRVSTGRMSAEGGGYSPCPAEALPELSAAELAMSLSPKSALLQQNLSQLQLQHSTPFSVTDILSPIEEYRKLELANNPPSPYRCVDRSGGGTLRPLIFRVAPKVSRVLESRS